MANDAARYCIPRCYGEGFTPWQSSSSGILLESPPPPIRPVLSCDLE